MSTYNINPYTSYSRPLLVPTHFTYNEDLDSEESLLVKLYAVILLCSTMMGGYITRYSSSTAYQINDYTYSESETHTFEIKSNLTEKFQTIKDVLGLTIIQQARYFDVSRQSIYKWFRGEAQPSKDNLLLLNEIDKAAMILAKNNFSGSIYAERVIENSKNLIDLVKEHKDGERYAFLLVDILKNEQQERDELNRLFGNDLKNVVFHL
ncbi:helix-turn-helix domain-containing protein [Acinetobacter guillouiae]|uniref:helix-turn-helix domain-containing protein n=1 Tax=Acinetobacter guillouiae TaxID=106649 RepID=UPI003AF8CC49